MRNVTGGTTNLHTEKSTDGPTDPTNQPSGIFADNSASNMQIVYANRHSPYLMEMEGLLPLSKGLKLNHIACLF